MRMISMVPLGPLAGPAAGALAGSAAAALVVIIADSTITAPSTVLRSVFICLSLWICPWSKQSPPTPQLLFGPSGLYAAGPPRPCSRSPTRKRRGLVFSRKSHDPPPPDLRRQGQDPL